MRSKKALFNICSNLILQIIVILYGFVVPKIIIESYGSNVNGLISSISQFLGYIILLESGFGPVVKSVLYKPIARKDNDTIGNILRTSEKFFRAISLIFVIYILILCIIYPMIVSRDFNRMYTISLIIIIGISTFAEYFFGMTYRLFLQSDQKTYIVSIIQVITYILSLISIVILIKLNLSIHIVKLISGLIFVLKPLLQNYYVKKKYNINFNNSNGNYILKQKWDGLAQHVASVIHTNTDVVILTIFTSLSQVSIYSVYYLVVRGIKQLIQSFINGLDSSFGDMLAKNEKENLNKKFGIYEVLYHTIATILYSVTIILISPFISVYTIGIKDLNYVNLLFGYLIVVSEYIWAIRQPYNELIKSAGHFKETRVGAWMECLCNVIISLILVNKYGIVGVTIGTIVAMTIRTIEFLYHTNKYILNRSIWESVKKILLIIFETILIIFICKFLPYVTYTNYLNWVANAFMVFVVSCVVTLSFNVMLFKYEFKSLIIMIKNIFKIKKEQLNN